MPKHQDIILQTPCIIPHFSEKIKKAPIAQFQENVSSNWYHNIFYSSKNVYYCACVVKRWWERRRKKVKPRRNVPVPHTCRYRKHKRLKIFDNKIVATRQLCVCLCERDRVSYVFNPCLEWWVNWQTATSDTKPVPGPLLHKEPDEWGPSALCSSLTFLQGLIQSDWTGRKWKEALHSTDKHSLTTWTGCRLKVFHD